MEVETEPNVDAAETKVGGDVAHEKSHCTGMESIESDEDSQMIDNNGDEDEDEGELSDDKDDVIETKESLKPTPLLQQQPLLSSSSPESKEISQAVDETAPGVEKSSSKPAQNDDELDFEEDIEEGEEPEEKKDSEKTAANAGDDDDEDEDGEVNSDDELEEGEVKGESDDEKPPKPMPGQQQRPQQPQPLQQQQQQLLLQQQQKQNQNQNQLSQQKNVCKFFHKGQCTWGPSCRFLHHTPSGHKQPSVPTKAIPTPALAPIILQPNKYVFGDNPPPLPIARIPDEYYFDHANPVAPIPRVPRVPPVVAPIVPPPPATSQEPESAWERGLRHAKAMMAKASRKKEEEVDFDEKRLPEDEGVSRHSHHSRESGSPRPSPRGRSPSPYHHRERERDRERDRERRYDDWNPEYERRRRLAYESAPWNDDPAPPHVSRNVSRNRESAEQFRDPWRRSRSPQRRIGDGGSGGGGHGRPGSTSGKRSHSMSSISGSDSASDLSGSTFSSSSFSGSESAFSDASDHEKSPGPGHRKDLAPPVAQSSKSQRLSSPVSGPSSQRPGKAVGGERGPKHQPPPPPVLPARSRIPPKPLNKERVQPSPSIPLRSPVGGPRSYPRTSTADEVNPAARGMKRKAPPPKARRDSWSDSDSMSGSQSGSSFFSGSDSESDAMSESGSEAERNKGLLKTGSKTSPLATGVAKGAVTKVNVSKIRESSNSPLLDSSGASMSRKSIKGATPGVKAVKIEKTVNRIRQSSPSCSPILPPSPSYASSIKSAQSPNSVADTPQKKPIKMTFMKKHSNLKKDVNVTAKLNGGQESEEEDGEEEEEEEEGENNSGENESNEVMSPEPIPETSMKEESNIPSDPGSPSEERDALNIGEGKQGSRSSGSAIVSSTTGGNATSSRREELLKQLKAVEDAIARKRAKLH